MITGSRTFFEASYRGSGFAAQRRYPNEELLRFLGRHYFALSDAERPAVSMLEVGCGSGANLWMMAREGFEAHGMDLSQEGVHLCRHMLDSWGVSAHLCVGDMTQLPYGAASMDVVVDVFSSYCLDRATFATFLDGVERVLKPGGRYFIYTPSKTSDAFRDHAPAKLLDADTLDGIRRESAPFHGNFYPFRFTTNADLAEAFGARGLSVTYSETVARTYRAGAEQFEFVVMVAEKPA